MKMFAKWNLTLLALVLFASTSIYAQDTEYLKRAAFSKSYNSWSAGLTAGNILLDGDLRSFGENENYIEFGFGAFVNKQINPVFSLQAEVVFGGIGGEKVSIGRKVDEGSFFNATLNGLLYINNIGINSPKKKKMNMFLKFGIGVVNFESTTVNFADANPNIQPSTTEIEIPIGFGIRYHVNKKIDLELASTMHTVFGDGFDGVGGTGGGAASESDKYFYTNIGVVYNIGKKEESLAWANPFDYMYDTVYDLKKSQDEEDDNNATDDELEAAKDEVKTYVDEEAKKLQELIARNKADNSSKQNNNSGGTSLDSDIIDSFLPSIYFAFESASLSFTEIQKLAVIAKVMNAEVDVKLQIVGFSDKSGSEEYNKVIALKRAENVKKYLVEIFGIDVNRLEVISKGESDDLAEGYNKLNRRVDFHIK